LSVTAGSFASPILLIAERCDRRNNRLAVLRCNIALAARGADSQLSAAGTWRFFPSSPSLSQPSHC